MRNGILLGAVAGVQVAVLAVRIHCWSLDQAGSGSDYCEFILFATPIVPLAVLVGAAIGSTIARSRSDGFRRAASIVGLLLAVPGLPWFALFTYFLGSWVTSLVAR